VANDLIASMVLAIWLYLLAARGAFWRAAEPEDQVPSWYAPWPAIAAIIPAPDETGCVGEAIASLLRQNYLWRSRSSPAWRRSSRLPGGSRWHSAFGRRRVSTACRCCELASPAIAAMDMAFTVDSAYQHARGRGGMWKGRAQANVSELR